MEPMDWAMDLAIVAVFFITLFFSWLSGESIGKSFKNAFISLLVMIVIIVLLSALGWVMFAGWRDK